MKNVFNHFFFSSSFHFALLFSLFRWFFSLLCQFSLVDCKHGKYFHIIFYVFHRNEKEKKEWRKEKNTEKGAREKHQQRQRNHSTIKNQNEQKSKHTYKPNENEIHHIIYDCKLNCVRVFIFTFASMLLFFFSLLRFHLFVSCNSFDSNNCIIDAVAWIFAAVCNQTPNVNE